MTKLPADTPPPQPFVHEETGAIRFWVPLDDGSHMGAILRREILHHCFQGAYDGDGALGTFASHRAEIEAAVRERAARGSREPVLLREADFRRADASPASHDGIVEQRKDGHGNADGGMNSESGAG